MANNISVSITADVADLTVKRAILSAELKAATADLNAFAKTANTSGMTSELRAGMLSSAQAVTGLRSQIVGITAELKAASVESIGFGNALTQGLAGLKTQVMDEGAGKLGAFGAALGALGPAGLAAAAGVAAVGFGIQQTLKTDEWAESLKRAAQTLGLTTGQLQEFDFAFTSMGLDVERGRAALSGLEKTIGLVESGFARSQQVKVFTDALKITPEDLRGWGTLEEQLPHILDALGGIDAETRAGLASRLKVDPEVLSSLVMEREEFEKAIQTFKDYGLEIAPDVIDTSAQAAAQVKVTGAIVQGELRKAFIDLSPVVVLAAQGIAGFARDTADTVEGVKRLAGGVTDVMDAVADFKTGVENAISPLAQFDTGIGDAANDLTNSLGPALNHVINPLSIVVDLLKQLGGAPTGKSVGGTVGGDLGGLGPTTKPQQLATTKPHHGRKGPSAKAIDEEQLAAIEAWQHMADAIAGIQDDMLQTEIAFWAKKVTEAARGSTAWVTAVNQLSTVTARGQEADVREIEAGIDAEIRQYERLTEAVKAEADKQAKIIDDGVRAEVQEHTRAVEQMKAAYESFGRVVNPIVSSFTSGMLKMVEGAESFGQMMRNLGQQILNDFISKVIDPMIERWLWKEARQTAASLLGIAQRSTAEAAGATAGNAAALAQTLLTIKQDAAKVFGGIFAALSSNPFTLPAAAPTAAAGAAAVMGFASFDVGAWNVPNDMLAQIHKGETIVPKPFADDLRANGGPWGAGGGHSFSFGPTNIQGSTNMGRSEVERLLSNHRDLIMKNIHDAVRGGWKSDAASPFRA